ncbi:MAG TPA: glycerol-3-phosphate acyltransferase [Anaerolineae bacterium]|nr:glycerol-3-phosphate acyltransferase [Anaerolineae bacterium]
MTSFLFVLGAYLWGSLSPSYLLARLARGVDLREYAHHEVDGTALGLLLGAPWNRVIGLIDCAKGILPPLLAQVLGLDLNIIVLAGLAVVAGHNWSVYLKFMGGRGLAAALGVVLVWDWRLFVLLAVSYALDQLLKQNDRLPMLGFLLLAPAAWLLGDAQQIITGGLALALLIGVKRLEANRLPLPADPREKRIVLWRRWWTDHDEVI